VADLGQQIETADPKELYAQLLHGQAESIELTPDTVRAIAGVAIETYFGPTRDERYKQLAVSEAAYLATVQQGSELTRYTVNNGSAEIKSLTATSLAQLVLLDYSGKAVPAIAIDYSGGREESGRIIFGVEDLVAVRPRHIYWDLRLKLAIDDDGEPMRAFVPKNGNPVTPNTDDIVAWPGWPNILRKYGTHRR
jgi:hypothetical protein